MGSDPSVAALAVVTHQSEAELDRHLAGHLAAAERLGAKLVVVDNASSDGTLAVLRARAAPAMDVVELERNRGYAAAVNVAFDRSPAGDVMVLNPDVALDGADPVRALAAHLAERPRAGLAAPRLIGPDGEVQPSARRPASLPAMLGSLRAGGGLTPLERAYARYLSPSRSDRPTSVGWVIGAAMLIRRRAFVELGGFDPGFFLYMEDADFCRRLNLAGWTVDYVPGVSLRHDYARASSAAGKSVLHSEPRRRHFASLARYWRKHPRALIGGDR